MALKLLLHLKTISWQLLHLKTISWLLLHLNAISWLLLSIKTMSAACIALSACFTGRLETLNSTLLFHTQVKLRPLVQDASLLQERGTHPLLPPPLQWPTQTFQAAPGMALKLLLHLETISWLLLPTKTRCFLLHSLLKLQQH
ncbi:uncharacterized protein LOC144159519 [Haemaphysalis longicornis]